MKLRRLYLDLDGVMADFDTHFFNEFGIYQERMSEDRKWDLIKNCNSWFLNIPLMKGAAEFFKYAVRNFEVIILTSCPKTMYEVAALEKRDWVYKHLGDVVVLPVWGGTNKRLFMHARGDILVDDKEVNCMAWEEFGGRAIVHKDFTDTIYRLESMN